MITEESQREPYVDFYIFFMVFLFQVPVIQLLLGQLGLVSSDQMLSIWRYVVVGAVVVVISPSPPLYFSGLIVSGLAPRPSTSRLA